MRGGWAPRPDHNAPSPRRRPPRGHPHSWRRRRSAMSGPAGDRAALSGPACGSENAGGRTVRLEPMDTPPHEGLDEGRARWQRGLRLVDPARTPISRRCRASGSSPSTGPWTGPRTRWPSAWAGPAGPPTPGARTPRCTARSSGPCGCSPGSAPPRTPTSASASSCGPGSGGLSVAFDLPDAHGPRLRRSRSPRVRSGAAAWPSTPWPTSRTSSPASTWARSRRR